MTFPATGDGSRTFPGFPSGASWSRLAARSALCGLGLFVAGCASQHQGAQGPVDRYDPRLGVSSSPRVVADGRPIPRGGGVYRVGRPYMVGGRRYTPFEKREGHAEVGIASWYGRQFHGRLTANGEIYDMNALSAAHRTMPMPSYARVTNLNNGHSLVVRINDRGPFHGNRVIDLSHRASHLLAFRGHGIARVKVEYLGRAPLEGSDDRMMLATLRTDGSPAPRPADLGGGGTMLAAAPAPEPRAQAEPAAAPVPAAPAQAAEAPAPGSLFQFASQRPEPQPAPAATEPATSAITLASAPLPPSRPAAIGGDGVAAAARSVPAPTLATVAAPPVQAAPQSVPVPPSAPVLATASSRPVASPAASAYAPPPAAPPVIAAMPGSGPARASLGFSSLY